MSGGPDAGKLLVTNDGATILSKIGVDNPVAKVLVGQLSDLHWPILMHWSFIVCFV